jgi:Lsr2
MGACPTAVPVTTGLWRLGTSVRLHACAFGLSTLVHQISERNGAVVAQKVKILLIDDLDGSEADGTVRFGLDGTEYEIDVSAENAQALRDALARYVGAARRTGGGARRAASSGRSAPVSGLNTTEVREWAKAQGIDVKDRGRVPAELVVKFKAATGK